MQIESVHRLKLKTSLCQVLIRHCNCHTPKIIDSLKELNDVYFSHRETGKGTVLMTCFQIIICMKFQHRKFHMQGANDSFSVYYQRLQLILKLLSTIY